MNLITLRDGLDQAVLAQTLDTVKGAGFEGVGLWLETIEGWLDAGRTIAQLADEIKDRGLTVDELCFVRVLSADGSVADQRERFEWAKELGARAVITIYGKVESPLEVAREDWARFVENVEDIGVAAAFEFVGAWPRYNSPLSAWQVVKDGPELGTLVFDTFHFWRGGCDLSQFGRFPGERVSLVHLNDVEDVPRGGAEDSDRTYPGEGIMPLNEILKGLAENGFGGPYSVEIFGKVQELDPGEVASHAFHAARKTLAGPAW